MRPIVVFGIIVILGLIGVYMLTNQNKQTQTAGNFLTPAPSPSPLLSTPTPFPTVPENERITANSAIIKTAKGNIEVELYATEAAKTVMNFATLAKRGFYNNLTFHRVEDWVIQGGDPKGDGSGGYSIYGETFEDELNPENPSYKRGYVEGVLAMANRGPNTNSSQFFILTRDTPLQPAYTIFGRVTGGMDVAKSIRVGDKILTIVPQELRLSN
jgi:cyclophilin family peptidyl-prolyl cis-trans isomerase